MSGDSIYTLKAQDQPLILSDLEYTQRLLEPFEDIVIEKFNESLTVGQNTPKRIKLSVFVAIGLVLFINFPTVREKSGLNQYILWLISTLLLVGVLQW